MTQNMCWPQGKRCAVVISVLFDDGMDAVAKAPDLQHRSKSFSVWQYGANRGVERLGSTFARKGVEASWFVPGTVAGKHASLIRDLASAGHDIESHGWDFECHETLDEAASLQHLQLARTRLAEVTGREPTGFRLPRGNWPQRFDSRLHQAGFLWSSSLNGDDIPYSHPSSLVEIPVHIELEDRPYFQFNFTPAFPKGLSRIPSYEGVLENWIAEFDAYRKWGLCYVLQLRPEMTGTPGRIFIVEALLDYIQQFDDVWLAKGADVARWWQEHGHPLEARHPLNVFASYQQECQDHV
jgi:peptidoglycan/xylan/chitin deacetylase (PgdA/CDA1 family)